jgi:hemolysin activation/secretion protein
VALIVTSAVHAQTAPNAGTLDRQLREERTRAPDAAPTAPPAAATKQTDSGAQVAVKSIVIEGATLIPMPELIALISDRVGQSLTLAQLERSAQTLAAYYRSKGYFARVYLPAQDVTNGSVRIRVVEGHLGTVKLNNHSTRADSDFVKSVVTRDLTPDAPYSAAALERGLLLANDLPGIRTSGVLEAGALPATSDLNITVEDAAFVSGYVSANNFGTQATGEYQGNAGLALNNLSGRGDQVTVRALGADKLAYGQLGYELPLGSDGLRAGVQGSTLKYRLGDSFEDLDGEGTAQTLGANVTYPVLRGVRSNVWLGLAAEDRRYRDDVLDTPLHRKQLRDLAATVNGNFADDIGGGAFTRYSVSFSTGRLDLSDVESDLEQDRAGPGADGHYNKLQLEFSRDQRVGASFFVRARLSGQVVDTNLDSSEKFSLGGPHGVRGYPVNEGSGDQGLLFNLELHRALSLTSINSSIDASIFFDAGRVSVDKDPWIDSDTRGNSYSLKAAGAALNWALPYEFSLNLTVATPVGDNAGEPSPDHNQDGRRRGALGWFNVNKSF